jgi:hypothetical protein
MNTTTMTHTHDTTLIEMRVVKAKPECIWHMLHQAENLKRLYEKSGVKVLALWMAQAGASHELITLVQHTSCASRAQYKDFRMTDTEWVKFDITMAKYFTEVEDYVCKTSVNFPTMRTINPTRKYLIQTLRYKGFLPFDSKKMYEASCELEKCEGENACTAVAMLIPMMSKNHNMIVIREWPEDSKADMCMNAYRDAVLDSKNWMHMHDASMHVARERSVLVRAIPFDKVAENAAME